MSKFDISEEQAELMDSLNEEAKLFAMYQQGKFSLCELFAKIEKLEELCEDLQEIARDALALAKSER